MSSRLQGQEILDKTKATENQWLSYFVNLIGFEPVNIEIKIGTRLTLLSLEFSSFTSGAKVMSLLFRLISFSLRASTSLG